MHKSNIPCAFTLIVLIVLNVTAMAQDAKNGLDEAFKAIEPKVIAWRREIHQNPELSNREFKTAAKVAEHLRNLGLDQVETGIAHTGVVGTLVGGRPGPVIAYTLARS